MNTLTILALASALAGLSAMAQDPGAPELPSPPHKHFGMVLKDVLAKYDVNSDAALDTAEYAALLKDIEEDKIVPPPPPGPRPPHAPGHFGGGRGGFGGHGPSPELMSQYDTDKDGHLNEAERAALHQDIQDGKVTPPVRQRRGDGAGLRNPPPEVVEKYDANKDGVLDENERATLRQDIRSGKTPPPHRVERQ